MDKRQLEGVLLLNADVPIQIGENMAVRSGTVIYGGCIIGTGFRTGHYAIIRRNCRIGDRVVIGTHSEIGHEVKIGDDTHVHSSVFVAEFSEIGKRCFIGPGALLLNSKYPFSPDAKKNLEGPILEDDVKVGGGAIIMPKVHIGANALIGAGAVVTHDVPSNAVYLGVPARWHTDVRRLGVGYEDQTD